MNTATLTAWAPRVLSVLRIVTALLYVMHGTQKFLGWPVAGPASLNTLQLVSACLETFGGLLLLVGLFSRPVAFVLSGHMAVAYWMAHAPRGLYPLQNMGEVAILFCFVFFYIIFAGPGPWSVDATRSRSNY